jgi:hypothetical protein
MNPSITDPTPIGESCDLAVCTNHAGGDHAPTCGTAVRSDDPALKAMTRVADQAVRHGKDGMVFDWYAGGYIAFIRDGQHALWIGHYGDLGSAQRAVELLTQEGSIS